jgi:hypothetical protein
MSDWDPNDLVVGVEGIGPVYPPTPEPPDANQPSLAVEVAMLVQGYIDDKINELRFELEQHVPLINREEVPWWYTNLYRDMSALSKSISDVGTRVGDIGTRIGALHATTGGLRDAVAELQSAESMPETVYRNFIKSEAERLRLMKPRVTPDSTQ